MLSRFSSKMMFRRSNCKISTAEGEGREEDKSSEKGYDLTAQNGPVVQFRLLEGTQHTVAFGQQKNTVIILGMDGRWHHGTSGKHVSGKRRLSKSLTKSVYLTKTRCE